MNVDNEVLDELIGICEQSIGGRFKKIKPEPEPQEDDEPSIDDLADLYKE